MGKSRINTNLIGLEKQDYKGSPTTLCAGCGHNSISSQIITAAFELGLQPEQVIKISGIGCSSKRDEANHTDFFDNHITYKINPDEKHSSLFELAEVFTFTTLEETDSSFITSPFMLEILGDYHIILDPGRKDIFIFDAKGNFIRKIILISSVHIKNIPLSRRYKISTKIIIW